MRYRSVVLNLDGRTGVLFRILTLSAVFLAGVLIGISAAGSVSGTAADELSAYLSAYFQLSDRRVTPGLLLATLFLYYRYPLLALLAGFSSIGVVLLPLFSAGFGFFLAFSVSCLTAALGNSGVLLALAAFGLRSMVTLPCFLILAVPALETSFSLARISLGFGRTAAVSYGRAWWLRTAFCALILTAAACADLRLSPWLLRHLTADLIT